VRQLLRQHAPSGPALWLVAGRGAGFAATFVVPLVLVRLLDQATFGSYKLLFLIYGTLYGLAQLGVAESLYFFVPRRPQETGRYAANAIVTLTLAGLGCAAGLWLAAPAISGWLGSPGLGETLPLLGIFTGLMLASALLEIVLVARGLYRTAAWIYGVSDVSRGVFLLVPVLLLGGLRGLLFGAVAFATLRVGLMLWLLLRGLGLTLSASASLWREQWTYTLPFAVAVGVDVLQANLHNYVVAARFDPAVFAIYAVGCLQIPLVDVLTLSSANVMMVAMAGDGPDRTGRALALWHDTVRRLALVIVPLVVFLVALAPEVITVLFTRQYLASVPVFQVWTCTLLFAVPCVDAVLRARARTGFLLGLNVVRLAIVVGIIGWCLNAFGLAGAAFAMLAATAATRVIAIGRIARLLRVGPSAVLPWKGLAITAACALVAAVPALWLARGALPLSPIGALLGGAALYATVYAGLCLRLLGSAGAAPVVPAFESAR
jgi:O-antigen/teichoic acid export membrane protein